MARNYGTMKTATAAAIPGITFTSLGRRAVGAGGAIVPPPQILADQLILSQPGGTHIMPTTLLIAPTDFILSYGPVGRQCHALVETVHFYVASVREGEVFKELKTFTTS